MLLNKLNRPARSFWKIYSISDERPKGKWGLSDAPPFSLNAVMALGAITAVLEATNLCRPHLEDNSFLRLTLFFYIVFIELISFFAPSLLPRLPFYPLP